MKPVHRTLLAIAAFVAFAVGSFIWFIANWDTARTGPIGAIDAHRINRAPLFFVSKNPGVWGKAPVRPEHQAGGTS